MLSLLFLLFLYIIPTASYTPDDRILLNCGASKYANDTSGRTWESDQRSTYSPENVTGAYTAVQSVLDPVPYQTARIFHSQFKYSFPVVSTGHKFLRLYFYPVTYAAFDTSNSFFSVTANGFTLLSNFSAFLHFQSPNQISFMKEFIINVEGDQRINLTFSPNLHSFAFVNGIEIISVPDKLYFPGRWTKFVPDHLVDLSNYTPLETIYRLNVGGADVRIKDDTGMFRYWTKDDDYIFGADYGYTPHDEGHAIQYTNATPEYSAPKIVYQTSRTTANTSVSLEWAFPVDAGFNYLLRFHFCEIQLEITKTNERVFTINIDNETAELDADVIYWTGSVGIPIFKDYTAWVPDNHTGHGKNDLRLSLFPATEARPKYLSALLNGLEILKLSNINHSLAAANPDSTVVNSTLLAPQNYKKNGASFIMKYVVVGSVLAIFAVIIVVSFLISRRCLKPATDTSQCSGSSTGPLPSVLCRNFSLGEIKTATGNFEDDFLIGKGGFGNVYKGFIDGLETPVAVKRLNTSSKQGTREFLTEIGMLSRLRHIHLVSLIGYCNENGEMILVYEYMVHGTLRDHLYNSDNPPLTWKQRLQICLGAARGLHYLHTSAKYAIIHRDVKSTNILLDENWVAKMSDFGISKVGPTDPEKMYVTTVVKGSFGYIDPEYYRLQHLTVKSDVYSLGVVLFEVLCNRPAVVVELPLKQANLAVFAKNSYREGTIEEIVDCKIKDQIAPECLFKFVETAIRCLRDDGMKRPAMGDVVWSLEFAMKLQLEAEERRSGSGFEKPSPAYQLIGQRDPNTAEEIYPADFETGSSSTNSGLQAIEVFTDLMKPTGR